MMRLICHCRQVFSTCEEVPTRERETLMSTLAVVGGLVSVIYIYTLCLILPVLGACLATGISIGTVMVR